MRGVFSDPSPAVGVKPRFLKFGKLPLACSGLCLTCPYPTNPSAALPSPHTGTVPSIPGRPACAPTHRRAPGWPPAPRPGTGVLELPLAPAAQPWCSRCGSAVAARQPPAARPWQRLVPAWPCAGTMARFSALPQRRGRAGACVPTLCLLPRTRGCSAQLGHPQHSDTSRGEGRVLKGSLWRVTGHCALASLLLAEKPSAPSILPLFLPGRGTGLGPLSCSLLSHGHGEAEIWIHVCRNLHLGKRPAIHHLRRKGRAACATSQGGCSYRKGKHPPCIKCCRQGPLYCCSSVPTASTGPDTGCSDTRRRALCHSGAPAPQELSPCPLLRLEAWSQTQGAGADVAEVSGEAAAGGARSRSGSQQRQHHLGRGWGAAGTGPHHLGVCSGSWVRRERRAASSC